MSNGNHGDNMTTRTITTKYPGRCSCGSRFAANVRVNWSKASGVTGCPACRAKREDTVIDGMMVRIYRRAGKAVRVSVLGGSCEVAPGWLTFADDGAPLIGGCNGMHNFDLWHDFGAAARKIAESVFAI